MSTRCGAGDTTSGKCGTTSNRSGTKTIISGMSNGKKGTKSTGSEGH